MRPRPSLLNTVPAVFILQDLVGMAEMPIKIPVVSTGIETPATERVNMEVATIQTAKVMKSTAIGRAIALTIDLVRRSTG